MLMQEHSHATQSLLVPTYKKHLVDGKFKYWWTSRLYFQSNTIAFILLRHTEKICYSWTWSLLLKDWDPFPQRSGCWLPAQASWVSCGMNWVASSSLRFGLFFPSHLRFPIFYNPEMTFLISVSLNNHFLKRKSSQHPVMLIWEFWTSIYGSQFLFLERLLLSFTFDVLFKDL